MYVNILPHLGGSKILVNISVNSCSGFKMVPKLEEGRRGGGLKKLMLPVFYTQERFGLATICNRVTAWPGEARFSLVERLYKGVGD